MNQPHFATWQVAAVHYASIACKPRCHFCDRIAIPLQPVQPRKLPSSSPLPPIHQAGRRVVGRACIYGTSCKRRDAEGRDRAGAEKFGERAKGRCA